MYSREAAFLWSLNPYDSDTYGSFYIFTTNLETVYAGITLTPDTNWHRFEVGIDFDKEKWISITIDDVTVDISNYSISLRNHADWSKTLGFIISEEVLNGYSPECKGIFYWSSHYRNILLRRIL